MKKILKLTDMDYSFQAHPVSGNLLLKNGSEAIKQSVKTLLFLDFFEKPFSPISANMRNRLFDHFDLVSESNMVAKIKEILQTYETRIVVENVTVDYGKVRKTITDTFVDNSDLTLNVTVTYRIIGEESQSEEISLIVTRSR